MFPYIKLTHITGEVIWIRYDTIVQVYMDNGNTSISTTTEDGDFEVVQSVDYVIEQLKKFYPTPPAYQSSIGEGVNAIQDPFGFNITPLDYSIK
jgi:hypothetical protein